MSIRFSNTEDAEKILEGVVTSTIVLLESALVTNVMQQRNFGVEFVLHVQSFDETLA